MQQRASPLRILSGDEPFPLSMIDPPSFEAIREVVTIESQKIVLSWSINIGIDGIDMSAVWESQRQINYMRPILLT